MLAPILVKRLSSAWPAAYHIELTRSGRGAAVTSGTAMTETSNSSSERRRRFAERAEGGGLERGEWVAAARRLLVAEGIQAVKIDRLAKALGVTRGGFYWRFEDHKALLDALVEDWRERNGLAMVAPLAGEGPPIERFRAFMRVLIDEVDFSPAYDMAVRAWARTEPEVAAVVKAVDAERLAVLAALFRDAGWRPEEADVRARITYYHQVGYYALDEQVPRAERYAASELYMQALTGFATGSGEAS
ncbi:TetR/AcrR family transcriptional regulator [Caulobacter sp. CCUG 60055]|nr:TetR/AcrR family transcriptional regulator [Caulobacter sp. CCUG 60055]